MMTEATRKIRTPRKRTEPIKLDTEKVLDLHEQGLNTVDIAKHQGVAPSTVWRFLERMKPEREAIETFKRDRADILARFQGKNLELQERIVDSFMADGIIDALKPAAKVDLLDVLNRSTGTLFDKERLERGKSTANTSVMHTILDQAFNGAHASDENNGNNTQTLDVTPQDISDDNKI